MNYLPLTAKKSLRTLGLFLVTLFAVTALSSCEPDDDDFYYDIVGRWLQVAPDYGPIYDFNGNGSGMCYDDYYGDSFFYWNTNGDYMTLDFGQGYVKNYTWSFQGSSLYLYPTDNYSNPLVLQPY